MNEIKVSLSDPVVLAIVGLLAGWLRLRVAAKARRKPPG